MTNFWTRQTLSRRSALRSAALAGGGLAALSLVGCGSKSKDTSGAKSSSSAITDSTKGKPGGVYKFMLAGWPGGVTAIDISNGYHLGGWVYSSLLAHKWGVESVDLDEYFSLEPDLATALPEQPDEQTLIFKLRNDAKFSNGRTVTAEDIKYSYDRYANYEKSTNKATWQIWYDHIETPDAQTVVLKTKFPYADTVVSTAGNRDGYIFAKEYEETAAAVTKPLGSGPFIYVSDTAPVQANFRKNPDYYRKPYPYFDEVQAFATTDVVKRTADFTSGQIHTPWLVYADDRDSIKQQRPDAVLQTWVSWAPSIAVRNDKAPFNDKRIRQALSMTIDRKKIRDACTKGEGRDDQFFALMYKNILGSREVTDLGAAAKYWQYNPAEAKKLLQAAGVDKPIESQMSHWDASVLGQWFVDVATLAQANWRELGVANVKDISQLNSQFFSTTQRGQYDGMAHTVTSGVNSGAPAFTLGINDQLYWGPNGEHSPLNLAYINDPQLSMLSQKQLRQLKLEDRKQTYRDMEPIIAENQYKVIFSTTTQNWLWDPSLRNTRISKEQGSRQYAMKWWFDKA